MTTVRRLRSFDTRVWRTATWAAPITIQVVLGVAVGLTWLLGKHPSDMHGFVQYAAGTVATTLLFAVISTALFMRASQRSQGIGISIVGSVVVAVVGAAAYGFWIIG